MLCSNDITSNKKNLPLLKWKTPKIILFTTSISKIEPFYGIRFDLANKNVVEIRKLFDSKTLEIGGKKKFVQAIHLGYPFNLITP